MDAFDRAWRDLFDRTVDRRRFLAAMHGAAAAVALGSLPGLRSDRRPRFRSNPFTLGVASGDPRPDGVVLWTRLAEAAVAEAAEPDARIPVRWEVADDDRMQRVVARGDVLALPELGHAVHAEVAGLEPGRAYHYRFATGGAPSAIGRTRTAPIEGAPTDLLRFAFASCQQFEHGYYTAYRHMAREDLDLVVHLGDYIYEKGWGENQVRTHRGGETLSLADYRDRYAQYRSDPDLQAAHGSAPWVVTSDDHEVDNDYAGATTEDEQSPKRSCCAGRRPTRPTTNSCLCARPRCRPARASGSTVASGSGTWCRCTCSTRVNTGTTSRAAAE